MDITKATTLTVGGMLFGVLMTVFIPRQTFVAPLISETIYELCAPHAGVRQASVEKVYIASQNTYGNRVYLTCNSGLKMETIVRYKLGGEK